MSPSILGAPSARLHDLLARSARLVAPVGRIGVLLVLVSLLAGAVVSPPTTDPTSDSVGATQGTFGVSETGAATYSLPIFTTPGPAGFSPKLSLEYNSQGGDGPLGKGWSIGGTSSITRCRAARETADFAGDNQPSGGGAGPVTMTSSDKLCLDGQRLVEARPPAGTPTCDALGDAVVTEFRTEIESNQRICAYRWPTADVNGNPTDLGLRFFTVQREDGTKSWYGDRRETSGDVDDAGVAGTVLTESVSTWLKGVWNTKAPPYHWDADVPTAIYTWAQTRRMDASGNYFNYQYLNVDQELYLSGIQYTGNRRGVSDLVPLNSVEFAYSQKPALNRPGFPRHLQSIILDNEGGVNEQQAIHGRVQG